ncbi:unnamed protein product [Amoebophrya sp. A25]|nr:unnamed protein product [Amoebophrya sp. A25]|eukprot:GSA25T00011741001.1
MRRRVIPSCRRSRARPSCWLHPPGTTGLSGSCRVTGGEDPRPSRRHFNTAASAAMTMTLADGARGAEAVGTAERGRTIVGASWLNADAPVKSSTYLRPQMQRYHVCPFYSGISIKKCMILGGRDGLWNSFRFLKGMNMRWTQQTKLQVYKRSCCGIQVLCKEARGPVCPRPRLVKRVVDSILSDPALVLHDCGRLFTNLCIYLSRLRIPEAPVPRLGDVAALSQAVQEGERDRQRGLAQLQQIFGQGYTSRNLGNLMWALANARLVEPLLISAVARKLSSAGDDVTKMERTARQKRKDHHEGEATAKTDTDINKRRSKNPVAADVKPSLAEPSSADQFTCRSLAAFAWAFATLRPSIRDRAIRMEVEDAMQQLAKMMSFKLQASMTTRLKDKKAEVAGSATAASSEADTRRNSTGAVEVLPSTNSVTVSSTSDTARTTAATSSSRSTTETVNGRNLYLEDRRNELEEEDAFCEQDVANATWAFVSYPSVARDSWYSAVASKVPASFFTAQGMSQVLYALARSLHPGVRVFGPKVQREILQNIEADPNYIIPGSKDHYIDVFSSHTGRGSRAVDNYTGTTRTDAGAAEGRGQGGVLYLGEGGKDLDSFLPFRSRMNNAVPERGDSKSAGGEVAKSSTLETFDRAALTSSHGGNAVVSRLTSRALANILWSLASGKVVNDEFNRRVARLMSPANLIDVCNSAWAFSVMKCSDEMLYAKLARHAVEILENLVRRHGGDVIPHSADAPVRLNADAARVFQRHSAQADALVNDGRVSNEMLSTLAWSLCTRYVTSCQQCRKLHHMLRTLCLHDLKTTSCTSASTLQNNYTDAGSTTSFGSSTSSASGCRSGGTGSSMTDHGTNNRRGAFVMSAGMQPSLQAVREELEALTGADSLKCKPVIVQLPNPDPRKKGQLSKVTAPANMLHRIATDQKHQIVKLYEEKDSDIVAKTSAGEVESGSLSGLRLQVERERQHKRVQYEIAKIVARQSRTTISAPSTAMRTERRAAGRGRSPDDRAPAVRFSPRLYTQVLATAARVGSGFKGNEKEGTTNSESWDFLEWVSCDFVARYGDYREEDRLRLKQVLLQAAPEPGRLLLVHLREALLRVL